MRSEIDVQALPAIAHRKRAEKAVGIAHANRRDARRPLQCLRSAIADALSRRGLADLQNAPGEMDHGREGIVAGPARLAAVERDARTNEVVVIGSTEENAGGIGKARPRLGKSLAKRLEALSLCLVLSVARLVGTSEMTHQERKLEGGQQFLGGRDGVNVSCGKAKPVHAAV